MSKVTIERKIEIDYGHTLPNHMGFCNQIHGHRGIVLAKVRGDISKEKGASSEGMVMDFKFLKQIMMAEIHDKLDHGFAVWIKDDEDLEFIKNRNKRVLITKNPPTAEYLAKWAYEAMQPKLPENIELVELTWFETPNASAVYSKEDYDRDNATNI